jgi:hypothetical protein
VQVVALAHRGPVVAHALEPHRDPAGVHRDIPLDQPAGTPEDGGQHAHDLRGAASAAPCAHERGVEHSIVRIEILEPGEVTGLDRRAQPLVDS